MESLGDALKNSGDVQAGGSEFLKKVQGMKRVPVGPCEQCRHPDERIPDRIIMKQVFEDGTEFIEPCICEKNREAQNIQRKINADRFYKASIYRKKDADKTFGNFITDPDEPSEAKGKESAMNYVKNFDKEHKDNGDGILFQGSYGTGKTHLALAINNNLYARGHKVLFFRFPDYINLLWKAINDRNQNHHPLKRMALEADLLIIDEVWADNDFEIRELYSLVDGRDGMATIYTTNNKAEDFLDSRKSERLGMSFSRMLDSSEVIVMTGKDKRKEKIRR